MMFVTLNAVVNAIVHLAVDPELVSLTMDTKRAGGSTVCQDMTPSAAREIAAALLAVADAVEGAKS